MKILRFIPALLVLFIFGCSSGPSPTTDYSDVITEMRTFIADGMETNNVTGMAIALVDGDRLVWSEGFGYADVANNIAASSDTIFEIGSVSKTLTTMMIMRLVDEGKLDIDAPIETYIPEFTINQRFPESSPITVRSILTHHSGLPTDIFIGSFTANEADPDWIDWLVAYLADEYTANPVDFSYAYSNTGFALLHKVIENASEELFYEHTDAMFDLIGMTDTTYGSRELPAERISKGYVLGEEQVPLYINISTAGSVRSTVEDMATYMSTILLANGGDFLNAATMDEVFSDQTPGSDADDAKKQGLCFFMGDQNLDYAGKLAWHNGATVDQTSHMTVLLDQGLGAIVLTNSITGSTFANETVVKTLQLALEAKTGIAPSDPTPPAASAVATPPDGLIATLEGVYVGESVPMYVTANDAGGMTLTAGEASVGLEYLENGRWGRTNGGDGQFEFRTVDGDIILFDWTTSVDSTRYGKLYAPTEISDAWQARVGDWEIINLTANDEANFVIEDIALVSQVATLSIIDGVLMLDGALRTDMALDPQSDTLAFTAGIGRNRGESVRIETVDDQEVLIMSGAEYVKSE